MTDLSDEAIEWLGTFLSSSLAATEAHPSWRLGQAYFNTLNKMRPDLASKIRGTHLDPFYSNTAIPYFLKWLLDAITTEATGDPPVTPEPYPGWDA